MNKIIKAACGLAFIGAVSTNAHASDGKASFVDVAEVLASAETCEARGYEVDYEGIAGLVKRVQEDAIASGMTEDEAGARMKGAIARAFDRKNGEFERASTMSHSRDHVDRFNYRWEQRCEDLASKSIAAAYFSRSGS